MCKDCHTHDHSHGHCHDHDNHNHHHAVNGDRGNKFTRIIKTFSGEILTGILLVVALLLPLPENWIKLVAYIIAVLPVGLPIIISTFKEWMRGDIFNEFTLMVLASVGAFLIGEYPEGVAVLLFYSVGEKLEDVVSGDVRNQIKNLLGKMPKSVTVIDETGNRNVMQPEKVKPGCRIVVGPGESVPLDGILLSDEEEFNTAAITGESLPRTSLKGEEIMSGVIPVNREVEIEVTHEWKDSSMSRIMQMIEDASAKRAKPETVLRRITRWYTPLVFAAAVLLFVIPWLVSLGGSYIFLWEVWFRRSLVFLVCSCPCALIVSIPLSYFAAIGISSKKGILFKGHSSLDLMRKVDTVYLDKTGTVTTGRFHVTRIISLSPEFPENKLLALAATAEQQSRHPLAKAIVDAAKEKNLQDEEVTDVKIIDHGIEGIYRGKRLLIGSPRLMGNIKDINILTGSGTTEILVALDGRLLGGIALEDTLKPGAVSAIRALHDRKIRKVGIMSGDTVQTVSKVAGTVEADSFRAALVPADKQEIVREEVAHGATVAFVGDGVNDAPALAMAHVGIAMGNLGTDLAIESANVVIASDDIRKISEGIDISKRVNHVLIENVAFAFGVKLLVMILGAFGIATLWAAVFADTGVTLITILWTLYRLKIWELREQK